MIENRKRYQVGLTLGEIYPSINGYCACGCGSALNSKQRKWASISCRDNAFNNFSVIKGDSQSIRYQLYSVDQGACRSCGEITEHWQADHIIPVCKGGGGLDINNFQTLCLDCHKEKTYNISHQSAISSQAASIRPSRILYEGGQHCNLSLNTSREKQSFVLATSVPVDRNFSLYR